MWRRGEVKESKSARMERVKHARALKKAKADRREVVLQEHDDTASDLIEEIDIDKLAIEIEAIKSRTGRGRTGRTRKKRREAGCNNVDNLLDVKVKDRTGVSSCNNHEHDKVVLVDEGTEVVVISGSKKNKDRRGIRSEKDRKKCRYCLASTTVEGDRQG